MAAPAPGRRGEPAAPAARPSARAVARPVRRAPPRAARETPEARRTRTLEILRRLELAHPDAHCALDHRAPLELLVATILSAQCTDVRVNLVTPELFRRFPRAADYARASQAELEAAVRSTGFFRNKAKALRALGAVLVEQHGGEVPATLDELIALPGVGRKTANVVLGNAFGKNEGVVVDTHVTRVSRRLGLTRHDDPVKIERDLIELVPREKWTLWAHLLIFHGRRICKAPRPLCADCPLADLCPSSLV